MQEDREIQEFRDLMSPPDHFEEGFGWKAVFGAIFVGMIMMPGSMYMGLVAGGDLGPAARWVTVILFLEVARRSFTTITRPELFVLYYMAGAAMTTRFEGAILGPLWNQFLAQSESARSFGLAEQIPDWVVPPLEVLEVRSFLDAAWVVPLALFVLTQLIYRIDHFSLGYVLYRITSDVERLPFPMAPVHAMGITALAESGESRETWRWRVFSIGGMIGLVFGAIYIGIPTISGVLFHEPVELLPIPWKDLTTTTQDILPAVPMGVSLDLTHVLIGMVLPFWAMVGEFLGAVVMIIVNPFLRQAEILERWEPGMDTIKTQFSNTIDFYYSFGIGLLFAIALIGFWHIFQTIRQIHRESRANGQESRGLLDRLLRPAVDRGDFPFFGSLAVYVLTTVTYILICRLWLIPTFPWWILVLYGFIYTPIVAYVQARLEGLVGQQITIPLVREGTFILSGYRGVDVWFAPIPQHFYAPKVAEFRVVELTGTRFTSILKAEICVFPLLMVTFVGFSHFIWRLAPIPSAVYPYAQKMWELEALNQCLTFSSTMGKGSVFYEAFSPERVALGGGLGLAVYATLSRLGLPVMLVYGLVRGLGGVLPHVIFPRFLGALLGRYYFRKKFGLRWPQYAPVVLAGFSCGMGLLSMFALGIVFLAKSIYLTPY
jgi:hypothetical protein